MRKRLLLLLLTLPVLLAGCGGVFNDTVGENEFYVNLTNHTQEDIYWLRVDFYLGETPCGSVTGGYADNSAIEFGDTFRFDFLPEDFPGTPDLSAFRMELSVLDAEEQAYAVKNDVKINAAYGNIYHIALRGNARDGYVAERTS